MENTWVLGSIVMNNYYTVFDLTPADGSLSIGVAKKNPMFIHPYSNTIPEVIKKHMVAIAAVVITVLLVCLAGGFLYKRR